MGWTFNIQPRYCHLTRSRHPYLASPCKQSSPLFQSQMPLLTDSLTRVTEGRNFYFNVWEGFYLSVWIREEISQRLRTSLQSVLQATVVSYSVERTKVTSPCCRSHPSPAGRRALRRRPRGRMGFVVGILSGKAWQRCVRNRKEPGEFDESVEKKITFSETRNPIHVVLYSRKY